MAKVWHEVEERFVTPGTDNQGLFLIGLSLLNRCFSQPSSAYLEGWTVKSTSTFFSYYSNKMAYLVWPIYIRISYCVDCIFSSFLLSLLLMLSKVNKHRIGNYNIFIYNGLGKLVKTLKKTSNYVIKNVTVPCYFIIILTAFFTKIKMVFDQLELILF